MKTETRLITPEVAAVLLNNNQNNRHFRKSVIARYAEEMLAGRWIHDTGESIKISPSGRLLDGQHRLMAVIEAGIPVKFLVCSEVLDESFKVIDSGVPRSSADAFGIDGIEYARTLPSIITTYTALSSEANIERYEKHSTTVLLGFYREKSMFWDEVAKKTYQWYSQIGRILSTSAIGSLYAYFYDIDSEDADKFMTQLCSGMEIKNKAIALLRKKLIDDKLATRKMPSKMRYALVIKAWNFFRKMESPKLLKISFEKEDFPRAI